jgi:hypothetical protein
MNYRPVFALCLLAIATASVPAAHAQVLPENCTQLSVPAQCTNNPNRPNTVRIQKSAGGYFFTPPNLCARRGDEIEFLLPGNARIAPGAAAILPKNPASGWLRGSNLDPGDPLTIRVTVPDVPAGGYDYGFVTSDGCVDPRVEVRN